MIYIQHEKLKGDVEINEKRNYWPISVLQISVCLQKLEWNGNKEMNVEMTLSERAFKRSFAHF